jgi:hypothetical protein
VSSGSGSVPPSPERDAGTSRDTSGSRDSGSSHRDASGSRDESTPRRDAATPPPTGDVGKLSVISTPWSFVSIDGRDTGRKTPLVNYELSAGIHRVCLRTEDGREHCTAVRVQAGQPARVVHNF